MRKRRKARKEGGWKRGREGSIEGRSRISDVIEAVGAYRRGPGGGSGGGLAPLAAGDFAAAASRGFRVAAATQKSGNLGKPLLR